MWEQRPAPLPPTQRRWSAPSPPTASLIQPGYTDLGPRAPRPLRTPAYPLSSRPILDQQTTPARRNSSNNIPSQQISPQHATPQRASQRHLRRRARACRLSRLSRRGNTQAQASPPTSPPPPYMISLQEPSHSTFSAFENPRPAPLPPAPLAAPSLESVLSNLSVLIHHVHAYAHEAANRRPLSVPPPPRDSSFFSADAIAHCYRPSSLQPSRFALCSACSRVRQCMLGIGPGRVLCSECLQQYFIDRQV